MPSTVTDAKDKFDVLQQWLIANGASFPSLSLRDFGGDNRGVHANEDIAPEQELFRIPFKLIITVEMGKAMEVGKTIAAANLSFEAPKHIYLMVFIME